MKPTIKIQFGTPSILTKGVGTVVFRIFTYSILTVAMVSTSAIASTTDGHYLKSNVAYRCVAPDGVMSTTRIFLGDGRYGEQWTSVGNPRHNIYVYAGKWRTDAKVGTTELLILSESIRLDTDSNRQSYGPRNSEQISPSKSNAKALYFSDAKSAKDLLNCEEMDADSTTSMREFTNKFWTYSNETRKKNIEYDSMTSNEKADENLNRLMLRAGRTDFDEYKKMSRSDRAARDLAYLLNDIKKTDVKGGSLCSAMSGQLRDAYNRAFQKYQQAESMAHRPTADNLYAAASIVAMNSSASYKCR